MDTITITRSEAGIAANALADVVEKMKRELKTATDPKHIEDLEYLIDQSYRVWQSIASKINDSLDPVL